MSRYAILNPDHSLTPCDLIQWARWKNTADCAVAKAHLQGYLVSTVFLGINHAYFDNEPSLWFETMIFQEGQWNELYCERYTTWDEALAGHKRACEAVRNKEIAE